MKHSFSVQVGVIPLNYLSKTEQRSIHTKYRCLARIHHIVYVLHNFVPMTNHWHRILIFIELRTQRIQTGTNAPGYMLQRGVKTRSWEVQICTQATSIRGCNMFQPRLIHRPPSKERATRVHLSACYCKCDLWLFWDEGNAFTTEYEAGRSGTPRTRHKKSADTGYITRRSPGPPIVGSCKIEIPVPWNGNHPTAVVLD